MNRMVIFDQIPPTRQNGHDGFARMALIIRPLSHANLQTIRP